MSDEELSAADEARIRGLLAAAKHDEPMPDAVVARLDRVLAGLAEEESPPPADVVRLADRRRRAARMLVAAAAVVVAGVGIGQVVSHPRSSGDSATAGNAPQDSKELRDAPEAGGDNGFGSEAASGSGAGAGPQSPGPLNGVSAYKVRPKHFAQDTRSLVADAPENRDSVASSVQPCSPGSWGAGRYVPVEYGRAAGYVVLRKPRGDSQVADLFLCQGDRPIRSITLPGP